MTPPTLRAWSPERVSLGLGVAKEELSTLGALGSGSRRLSLVSGCRRRCQEEAARLAVCAISGAAGGRDGRGTATGGAGGRRGMPIWRCSPSVGSGCRGNRASVRAAVVLFDGGFWKGKKKGRVRARSFCSYNSQIIRPDLPWRYVLGAFATGEHMC